MPINDLNSEMGWRGWRYGGKQYGQFETKMFITVKKKEGSPGLFKVWDIRLYY